MRDLKSIFTVIKFSAFCTDILKINPKSGISHRFSGKGTGAASKTKDLTDEDKKHIAKGLISLGKDMITIGEAELKHGLDDESVTTE